MVRQLWIGFGDQILFIGLVAKYSVMVFPEFYLDEFPESYKDS
jgi:hypothetical protein